MQTGQIRRIGRRTGRRFALPSNASLYCCKGAALSAAFGQLYARLGTPSELEMADEVYASLSSVDFSRDILQVRPEHLAVLPVTGVAWNDLGSPERVTMSREMTSGQLAMA